MDTINDSHTDDGQRRHDYNIAIKVMHWLMAFGFLLMIISGIVMEYTNISKGLQFQLYQLHKSGGVLLIFAFIFRVVARLGFAIPKEFAGLSEIERRAAKFVHVGLYILMIAIPLTGWLMVSASGFGLPTIVFGWFEWPHIPNLQGNEFMEGLGRTLHTVLAWLFSIVIFLHVIAAVKHQLLDKQEIFARILPGRNAP